MTMEIFEGGQFLTVLGSHDGLAQKQVREILVPEELERHQHAFILEWGGLCNPGCGDVAIIVQWCT